VIERLCKSDMTFIALAGGRQPHFTTIANFVSNNCEAISSLFHKILLVCDQSGLIGKKHFAIDGCKLPTNASKQWSGTHKELRRKSEKMKKAAEKIIKRHMSNDSDNGSGKNIEDEKQTIEKLMKNARKIDDLLADEEPRMGKGKQKKEVQSNITDNESAKMKTSHGVIQGYVGVSAVDSKNQIIISAEAFGQCQEHDLLEPIVNDVKENLGLHYMKKARLTADSGFHNKHNVAFCQDENIDAYIADKSFRSRDPRFKDYKRFKPETKPKKYFTPTDFSFNKLSNSCSCPAGKKMWQSQSNIIMGEHIYHRFEGYLNDCRQCSLQKRCMRRLPTNRGRQVSIRIGDAKQQEPSLLKQMQEKIDSRQGRHIYSQRLGTVEPVFGNINTNKRLNRFSLRGKTKVNAQWLMFCMVHNIEKFQHYGSIH